MAFVHDQVTIVPDDIVDDSFPAQALQQGDINDSVGLCLPPLILTICLASMSRKGRKPGHPLVDQLLPMDQY